MARAAGVRTQPKARKRRTPDPLEAGRDRLPRQRGSAALGEVLQDDVPEGLVMVEREPRPRSEPTMPPPERADCERCGDTGLLLRGYCDCAAGVERQEQGQRLQLDPNDEEYQVVAQSGEQVDRLTSYVRRCPHCKGRVEGVECIRCNVSFHDGRFEASADWNAGY